MAIEHVVKVLEGIFYTGSLAAFGAGLISYWRTNREKRREDQYNKYRELQNRYVRYLELSMAEPAIGLGEFEYDAGELSAAQEYKRKLLFFIFISIIEEAYLLRDNMEKSQWIGWDNYVRTYASTDLFRKLWFDGNPPRIGWTNQFSRDFEKYVETIFIESGVVVDTTPARPKWFATTRRLFRVGSKE